MRINNLKLINFRNYKSINLNPGEYTNILVGKNAQGKTNLLESIAFILKGKSFRTNIDRQLINFDSDYTYIKANIVTFNLERQYEISYHRSGKKIIKINNNEIDSLKELRDDVAIVLFLPTDLNIIKNSPAERRKFLDYIISQINPLYEYNLNKYRKILAQRNKLLKANYSYSRDKLLDVYSTQLSIAGVVLLKERLKIVRKLNIISQIEHKNLTGGAEYLKIVYLSTFPFSKDESEMEKIFYEKLQESKEEDLEKKTTTLGPHRDDLSFLINGKDARIYGSQGQQRSIVLSLKLSEMKVLKEEKGYNPILLLDDVFSELDEERRNYFVKNLEDVQSFITTNELDYFIKSSKYRFNLYKIENSNIRKEL